MFWLTVPSKQIWKYHFKAIILLIVIFSACNITTNQQVAVAVPGVGESGKCPQILAAPSLPFYFE